MDLDSILPVMFGGWCDSTLYVALYQMCFLKFVAQSAV